MRILAAVTAATICTAAGVVFSSVLKRRCTQLELLTAMFTEMSEKIRRCAPELDRLLYELRGEEAYRGCFFLRGVCERLESGEQINRAWCAAADETPFLSERDRDILRRTGEHAGENDIQGELSLLSLAVSMLERSLDSARAEYESRGRMLLKIWPLMGIAAGIMIL